MVTQPSNPGSVGISRDASLEERSQIVQPISHHEANQLMLQQLEKRKNSLQLSLMGIGATFSSLIMAGYWTSQHPEDFGKAMLIPAVIAAFTVIGDYAMRSSYVNVAEEYLMDAAKHMKEKYTRIIG